MEEQKNEPLVDTSLPIEEIIEKLKTKSVEIPDWDDIAKDYVVENHPIVSDPTLRPKEKVKNGQRELPAKVTYGAEKIATRRAAQMAFTIPVKRIYNTLNDQGKEDPTKKAQSIALEKIYTSARIDGQNMKRMKAYFAACEIVTVWYAPKGEKPHNKYGFQTPFKLRCRSYSPMPEKLSRIKQANLYPHFDEYDDMIGMSFEYTRSEGEDSVTYFETYTADTRYKWRKGDGDWEAIEQEPIVIMKHPLAYLWRTMPFWEDSTSNNRNEIEFALSRESDIIRKNSKPIVKISGKIVGDPPVGDTAREVYVMNEGGDISLVAPAISSESTKYYVDAIKQNIEEDTQMPNLSLENVKGLGPISGEARRTLLTDGHLRVGEEKHDIIEFFDRECNVLKAFLGMMNVAWKDSIHDLEVEHVITPFVQNDKQAKVKELTDATGGKAIKSQRTAIEELGDVDDVDAELGRIQEEEKASQSSDIFGNSY